MNKLKRTSLKTTIILIAFMMYSCGNSGKSMGNGNQSKEVVELVSEPVYAEMKYTNSKPEWVDAETSDDDYYYFYGFGKAYDMQTARKVANRDAINKLIVFLFNESDKYSEKIAKKNTDDINDRNSIINTFRKPLQNFQISSMLEIKSASSQAINEKNNKNYYEYWSMMQVNKKSLMDLWKRQGLEEMSNLVQSTTDPQAKKDFDKVMSNFENTDVTKLF